MMSVDIIKQIDFYLDHWGGDTLVQGILLECRDIIKNTREGFEGCCQTCEPVGVANRELVSLTNKLRWERDDLKKTLQEKSMQYLSNDYEVEEIHNYCEQLENRCSHLETDRNNLHLRVQEYAQTFKKIEGLCKEACNGWQG